MTEKVFPIAIIGGGAAGTMSLLRATLNNDESVIFPGHQAVNKKSRDLWITRVENMPTFAQYRKGIQEPNRVTLKWLQESKFAEKINYKKGLGVEEISKNPDGTFHLVDNTGETYTAKYVILCTGVMDAQPIINGTHTEILPYSNVQHVEYCARCDGHHTHQQDTAVLGHNAGAASVACLLAERYQHPSLTILTNGKKSEFSDEQKVLMNKYRIEIKTKVIKDVVGDPKKGKLKGFRFADNSYLGSNFVFVSLGMYVYNELALQMGARVDQRGFVLTDEKGETNIDGLYCAGDLRAGLKKQIYTAWDSAVDSADGINARLREQRRNLVLASSYY